MPNGLLDVSEVAEMAGLRVTTIYTYLHRGQMPPADLRIGQSPVWRRETIEAWLPTRKPRKRRQT